MKVNIIGKGVISGIGLLPAYNKELTESEIRRLLNFQNVRVFQVGGGLITKSSFMRSSNKRPATPVRNIDRTIQRPTPVPVETAEAPDENPVVESLEEAVVTTADTDTDIEAASDADNDATVSESNEEVVDVDETTDVQESEPASEPQNNGGQYNHYNKKKKHR